MSDFFGELYLRSTLPFLDPKRTEAEVDFLARTLANVQGPIVDLGCGHGRHAAPLSARLGRKVVGLELDPLSLAEREPGFPVVRADLRVLPFLDGSLAAAYAWYSTLFVFSEQEHAALLADIARALRPGGKLIFQTVPYERLAEAPEAVFRQTLPDGSTIDEDSRFDPSTGMDRGHRRLTLADGRVLEANYAIRYYPTPGLPGLLADAGFRRVALFGTTGGSPIELSSRELIAVVER